MRQQPTCSVLGLGAWLKNTACLLDRHGTHVSEIHGDLSDARACLALETSARNLRARSAQPLAAIACDLHPDFYSTRLAMVLAKEWEVETVAVQHHHAHIGAVMAIHELTEPVIGLALDGVGLGLDGTAWGGELLWVEPSAWKRLGHLWPLALPGGNAAASQPWRMLASALHAMGRGEEISSRLSPVVGANAAHMIRRMLDNNLNCPVTTSAGRWFDAAAAALGWCVHQQREAEAAVALEQQARRWFDSNPVVTAHDVDCSDSGVSSFVANSLATQKEILDLRPILSRLLACPSSIEAKQAAAAWFHLALAFALADWAAYAARQTQCRAVCLGGGCFMNAVLVHHITRRLQSSGLRVYQTGAHSCGDAGLALGQAWVASQQLNSRVTAPIEGLLCV